MEVLRKPLPVAFRINASSQSRDDVQWKLESDFRKSLQAEVMELGQLEAIRPLPWYPENLAWHTNFSRNEIRKTQTLDRFHEFLKLENELGNITRQEVASMVPSLFLDVQPDHFVLDMCAAPGSKTFQLLDLMHQSTKCGLLPDGMVMANDVEFKRCDLLIHRTKKICTSSLIVTNQEGQRFPCLHLDNNLSDNSEKGPSGLRVKQLLFDRVLCDVPCGGDGTLRKYPSIWRTWRSGIASGLHNLQVLLAMQGLAMLKVGGRMVYSTCSLNPIENEAVIAEVLRRCGRSVQLVDVSTELPELIRRPGLKKWKVFENGVWYPTHNDVPVSLRGGILPSMFPVSKDYNSENRSQEYGRYPILEPGFGPMEHPLPSEEVADLPLERCIRIMPHDQNTGAFFVAVLQKFSPSPTVQEISNRRKNFSTASHERTKRLHNQVRPSNNRTKVASANDTADALYAGAVIKANSEVNGRNGKGLASEERNKWTRFDPVVFLKDEALIKSIQAFYGIDECFPLSGHLVLRNSDTSRPKRIYYISKAVKDLLELNSAVGEPLKIPSVGIKIFERQSLRRSGSMQCLYRISSAVLPILLPFITKQVLYASFEDFERLLQLKAVKFEDTADPKFGNLASNLMAGFCVVVLGGSTIAVGCWKGKSGGGLCPVKETDMNFWRDSQEGQTVGSLEFSG